MPVCFLYWYNLCSFGEKKRGNHFGFCIAKLRNSSCTFSNSSTEIYCKLFQIILNFHQVGVHFPNSNLKMGEQQGNAMWVFLKSFSNKFSMPDFVNGNDKRGNSSARKHISYDKLGSHDREDFLSSSNPHLQDIVENELDLVRGGGDSPHHLQLHSICPSSNVNANTGHIANSLTPSKTTPSLSSTAKSKPATTSASISSSSFNRFGSISLFKGGGRSVDFNMKTKKFVFPNFVPSCQEDQDKNRHRAAATAAAITTTTNITENVKDANWLEIEGDGDSGESSENDEGKCGEYDGASSCTSDYEDDDEEETKNGTRCGICGCEKKYEVGVVSLTRI